MKQLIALVLALIVSTVNADTTGNVLSGTSWSGVTNGTLPSNRMPGSALLYDTATGTVNWSYSTATASKTVAINNALSGSGVQVGGYNYTYDLRNMNGDDRQGSVDTMTVLTKMTSNTGATLLSNTNTHNTKFDWTTFSGTQTLSSPAALSGVGNLNISFTSRDTGYWAGYFGPEVKNVGMSLNYTVDPCITNPAYRTTCPNYNTVSTSTNLFTGTTGTQAYAINTALAAAGAGATIHGFDYGYDYRAAARDCAIWNLFSVCLSGWNYSSAAVTTTLTNSAGVVGFTETNTHAGGDNGVSGSYSRSLRLNSSVPMSTLGTFSMTPSTIGDAGITNMYSRAVYTADPCTINPLSSTSCPGYAQAYHDQRCAANPLYAVDCVGYAAAYMTQQCSANALYNSQCPGYAAALFTQQCTNNPLSDSTCPGYQQAYFNQQCSASALYSNQCPGYQQAYLTQQCNISSLYSNQCPGYQQAYHDQQCSASALYMSDCPGYQAAYLSQQCSINSLYSNQCPGYTVAYHNQQCNINPLYANDCTGYAAAYHTQQCTANPLYMTDCPGYQAAYLTQQCNISQLYSSSCPGYQQAYFNQQCNLNGLYDRSCPNYGTAYAAKNILSTPTTTVATSTVSISSTSNATVTSNPAAIAISDPTVAAAVSTPSTTSTTSPTSVTSVINPPSNTATTSAATAAATPAPAPAPTAEAKQEARKTEGAVARAAARGNAAAAAKDAVAKASNAKSLEDQAATQGLVVGLMGYVPGFNAYQNALVPDVLANSMARQYTKPNVDNRNAQRRLSGSSDARWQEMVDSQYRLGDQK